MAGPDQEAIDTFMSITGVSEATAIQKLEEHHGNLNEAVNSHFNEADRNITPEASITAPRNDVMDIDDPILAEPRRPFSLLPSARDLNPFSLFDPNFSRTIFDTGTSFGSHSSFVSHPREVREIPIEVKDGNGPSGQSGTAPIIEDVSETAHHGPEIRGTVTMDDDDDDDDNNGDYVPNTPFTHASGHREQNSSTCHGPSAPAIVDVPDYSNDIEEEMIRAAIEASKRDAAMSNQQFDDHLDLRNSSHQPRQSHLEDTELAHAVSSSLKTAEQEKVLQELEGKAGVSRQEDQISAEVEELGKLAPTAQRQPWLEVGSSSIQDEAEDAEEHPLVRHGRRHMSPGSVDTTTQNIEEVDVTPLSSPRQGGSLHHSQHSSDEWGGISSEEHDEAVMLEAAMLGGIPERSRYHIPYAPHQLMQNGLDRPMDPYLRDMPRPPSPALTAQRLIREQQDDEFLASLQADKEKELKAREVAETALVEERRKEEELQRKIEEEQEIERQLAAKEASLPQEPTPDDENAVTLLVRMPDGSRRGRRFLKSDKLQYLFDFIDVGRGVKPGGYRLVRPYPRRAFADGESYSTLNELGLTSKQEALYLESK
ncbi:plant UBX domain-containing protein 8-like isoform X2 [Olea europaea var. sylvestris]|uniref:Plant UBX domain-containing 8-like isoform X1 n=1 Tax=Olea europaea subsp. europaea TaxID=158383 RepID=A0A8S0SN57_OLEEU|nr:plant UBX domain-containing protein 8-like isoform X2 [Olea europaea var. sylvestris]CAA2993431.1 plant UBX domain-containing 8-like isoform X1 [Olea europaea subsp. europaea]